MMWPEEAIDDDVLVFTARRSVRAHDTDRACCVQCPGEGCRQYAWALETITAYGQESQGGQDAQPTGRE